jgi:transcriptional regulator with XRE-family HTH domain
MEGIMRVEDWQRELAEDVGYRKAAAELKPFLDLADDVLAARLARGWSQADLAQRVGTRQANISRIESGLSSPTLKLLQKLAEAIDAELTVHLRPKPKEWGVGEAEVIRQAIEREATSDLAQCQLSDATALEETIQAALQRREVGITGQPYRWRREDAYAEK